MNLETVSLSSIPTESLKPAVPWLSPYYRCPKCKGSVQGVFGRKDSKGQAYSVSECMKCGYVYKTPIK